MLELRRQAVLLLVLACTACGSGESSVSVDGGIDDACPDEPEVTPPDAGGGDDGSDGVTTDDAVSEDDAALPCELDAEAETWDAMPPQSACVAVAEEHPDEGHGHVAACSPVTYATNPPSSGNHYPFWAAYRTYAKPIPRGFWVHNLEHGAVVITYNCPGGCPLEVAQAHALIEALPEDCGPVVKRRLILAPDPELDVRFAASAWGFTLRAECFEREAFFSFITAHYAHGLEDVCSDGVDPTGGPCGPPICR
ncbi:MAG TPA: DUF3105 domain-containing protein [Polyangiaceae bacterium]